MTLWSLQLTRTTKFHMIHHLSNILADQLTFFFFFCQTPVLGLGLGVDFTLANNNNNNNNPHPNFPGWDGTRGLKFGIQT